MNTKKMLFASAVALAMVAPMGLSYVLAATPPNPPSDTNGCLDAGSGGANEYHIYWLSGNVPKTLAFTQGIDTCSTDTTETSEVAGAIGGATLFAYDAQDRTADHGVANQGGGTTYCYNVPPLHAPAHHGGDKTITVRDFVLGDEVGFTVFGDWSRGTDNGVPGGPGNTPDGGTQVTGPGAGRTNGCGDGLIEPCPGLYDDRYNAVTAPNWNNDGYIVTAGCNNDDTSVNVPPGHLGCDQDPLLYDEDDSTIFLGTGRLTTDLTDNGNLDTPTYDIEGLTIAVGNDAGEVGDEISWATGFPGQVNTGTCTLATAASTSWPVPGGATLDTIAGADGTVGLFITTAFSNQLATYGTVITS